jgi:hypothetical protein
MTLGGGAVLMVMMMFSGVFMTASGVTRVLVVVSVIVRVLLSRSASIGC